MEELELEEKKLAIMKLELSKADQSFKIKKLLAEIERVKENIAGQDKAIAKIKEEYNL